MSPKRKAAGKNVTGRRIREARLFRQKPVSQVELIAKLARRGIYLDQTSLSRIERRERLVADYELISIARCLKVSIAWLCGERGAKP